MKYTLLALSLMFAAGASPDGGGIARARSARAVQAVFAAQKQMAGGRVAPYAKTVASTLQAAQPSQSDSEDAKFKTAARRVLSLLVAGEFAQVRQMFNEEMKNGLSEEKMRELWASMTQNVGAYRQVTQADYTKVDGYDLVIMRSEFERGFVQVRVAYDGQGKIGGLYLIPSM